MSAARKRSWVGGRTALRQALVRAGLDAPPVLADGRGAPMLPPGVSGSISHKETIAVALVAREGGGARVGVDVELDVPPRVDIASKVLTDEEMQELAALDARARGREVLLRFSAKEAVYKALDPFVKRFVAFQEVSVSPLADGRAVVADRLRAEEGPFTIDVRWRRLEGLVLNTARVTLR
jgi:4'-phosphopantetheinyl transferase EntD